MRATTQKPQLPYRVFRNTGSSGGAGKSHHKRKVWYEYPTGTEGQRARCACHHSWPCPVGIGTK